MVHYTVGRLCQKIGEEEHRREFSRQTIAAIAETTFRECGEFLNHTVRFSHNTAASHSDGISHSMFHFYVAQPAKHNI